MAGLDPRFDKRPVSVVRSSKVRRTGVAPMAWELAAPPCTCTMG